MLTYLGFLGGTNNGFYFFGGTSAGSPQWSGITADVVQAVGVVEARDEEERGAHRAHRQICRPPEHVDCLHRLVAERAVGEHADERARIEQIADLQHRVEPAECHDARRRYRFQRIDERAHLARVFA